MAIFSCIKPSLLSSPCRACLCVLGSFHRRFHSHSYAVLPSACAIPRTSSPSLKRGTGFASSVGGRRRSATLPFRTQLLSAKAFDVSGPGTIDSPLMSSMQTKIKEQLGAEDVTVKDAYGDGRHVSIDVVAEAFEGQSRVNRQRMVYKAIWEELQSTVHAVDQLRTRTPAEVAAAGNEL